MMTGRTSRIVGAVGAMGLVVAAGCGETDDPDDLVDVEAVAPEGYEATPAFLSEVSSQSSVEPHRFEMWMTLGAGPPTGEPMFRGAEDGERLQMITDTAAGTEAMNETLAREVGPSATIPPEEIVGLEMELVREADLTHLRMPFLLDAPDDRLSEELRELRELVSQTDGWMTVQPSQLLTTTDEELDQVMGSDPAAQDPSAMIDVIAEAEGATDLGVMEMRGEDVVGIEAEIGFPDLIAADGTDPDAFLDMLLDEMVPGITGAQVPEAELDEFSELMRTVMTELTLPTEVWVDGDGYLRRMAYTLDMEQVVAGMVTELGEEPPPAGAMGLQMRFTMDFFDYGDGIDIAAPDETTDLTDRPELFDYWALTELGASF